MAKRPQPKTPTSNRPMPVTHHEAPPEEMHRGTLFVVRDEDWEHVWAANVTYQVAAQVKERVAGRRLSRTVLYEPMPVDDVELMALCLDADEIGRKIARTPELEEAHRRLNGEPPPAVKAAAEKKRRELEEKRRAAELAKRRAQQAAPPPDDDEDDFEEDDSNGLDPEAEALEGAAIEDILEQ